MKFRVFDFIAGLVLLLLCAAGCAGQDSVMARTGGTAITRGEFLHWLEGRGDDVDAVMLRKAEQRRKLKRMALEILTIREAEKAGYHRSDNFNFLIKFVEKSFCADFYERKLDREGWFEGDAAKIRVVGFRPDAAPIPALKSAESLARELNGGAPLERAVKKTGFAVSSPVVKFVVRGMTGAEIPDELFSAKIGATFSGPAVADGRAGVVTLLDRRHLDRDNFDSFGVSGPAAEAMRKFLRMRMKDCLERRLLAESDVIDAAAQASRGAAETVIFSIGGDVFTVSDLNRVLSGVYLARNKAMGLEDIPAKLRIDWAKQILAEGLIYREASRKGICATEEYARMWEINRRHALASGYMDDVILSKVTVTPAEVRRDYDMMLAIMERSRKKGIISPAGVSVNSFEKAMGAIKAQIRDRKRMVFRQSWEEDLLKREGFSVIESELRGI